MAGELDRATYVINVRDENGQATVNRGEFDDRSVEGAIAVVALSDEEHDIAAAQFERLGRAYGLTRSNATVLLGQAASYAVREISCHPPESMAA